MLLVEDKPVLRYIVWIAVFIVGSISKELQTNFIAVPAGFQVKRNPAGQRLSGYGLRP